MLLYLAHQPAREPSARGQCHPVPDRCEQQPHACGDLSHGLAYAAVGSALTLTGAGRYSLDHLTGHVLDKPWMRAVAYVSAVGAAAAIIVARRNELASRPAPEVVTEATIDEAEAPHDPS